MHLTEPVVSDDPARLPQPDLVLLGVKLPDTAAAIAALRPVMRPGTAILSLQNGVTKDDVLRVIFGTEAVMGGVTYVSTRILRPGVIGQTGPLQRLVLGEYDGTRTDRVAALLDATARAGVAVEHAPDIRVAIWQKFTFLVGHSGTTAAMRLPIGPIRENPRTRAFLRDVIAEVVAVARAAGVALPDDAVEGALRRADTVPPGMTSTMHEDLEAGRRLELPWLSGTVVDLGHLHGVPTPYNRAIRDILAAYADGPPRPPSKA
ncbi:ketopantoate reductase family protein [Roseomonas sp. CCTCC AB2023176]|uniref:ketopantoate reductase family protein n=1 Tax=Roseomonas sp. CCTCC AB2023176 TaxID=3342640 RepID=UPI0035DC64F0